jgi:16S rRNA (adenine1518-N6/adenine1519-N6)-dimethyltransferase
MMERVRAKKSLGQNFLVDQSVLERIVSVVAPNPGDHLLEIGPGQGALTGCLVDRVGRLVAVELDKRLLEPLTAAYGALPHVSIVEGDILRVDLPRLLQGSGAGPWKVAANLPYNISSQVLFLFLETPTLFSRLVLMLQKEVGDRLVARSGTKEYGILSVFCALHFDVVREFLVKPGSFRPIPKVDSVVLRFTPLPAPRCDVGDEAFFRRVVKAAFGQRRKTLWNCLKVGGVAADDETLREVLAECGIDPGRRGETLDLEEFARLSRALQRAGKVLA